MRGRGIGFAGRNIGIKEILIYTILGCRDMDPCSLVIAAGLRRTDCWSTLVRPVDLLEKLWIAPSVELGGIFVPRPKLLNAQELLS